MWMRWRHSLYTGTLLPQASFDSSSPGRTAIEFTGTAGRCSCAAAFEIFDRFRLREGIALLGQFAFGRMLAGDCAIASHFGSRPLELFAFAEHASPWPSRRRLASRASTHGFRRRAELISPIAHSSSFSSPVCHIMLLTHFVPASAAPVAAIASTSRQLHRRQRLLSGSTPNCYRRHTVTSHPSPSLYRRRISLSRLISLEAGHALTTSWDAHWMLIAALARDALQSTSRDESSGRLSPAQLLIRL